MSSFVQILGHGELPENPRSGDAFAQTRARYTRMLIEESCGELIDNAPVETRALVVGDDVWPLIVSNPKVRGTDLCSPLTWYVHYVASMHSQREGAGTALAAAIRAFPMRALMTIGNGDSVVYLNNWIAAANPPARLDPASIEAITNGIASEWPDRAIIVRGVTPGIDPQEASALTANGYRLVRARSVEVIDGRDPAVARRRNVRRDIAALAGTDYEIVEDPDRLLPHCDRLAELYRGLYIDKYASDNPQRNARYFERTIAGGLLRYRALFRDGRPDAFVHSIECGSVLMSFSIGYDLTVSRSSALYRMLVAMLIEQAIEDGLEFNLSSGAGRFKLLRGARTLDEFDAVYDAHLPMHRRLPWSALQILSNRHSRALATPEVAG